MRSYEAYFAPKSHRSPCLILSGHLAEHCCAHLNPLMILKILLLSECLAQALLRQQQK